ncbi:hypothetical protein VN97_g13106, partial [Penicillium thymicola]
MQSRKWLGAPVAILSAYSYHSHSNNCVTTCPWTGELQTRPKDHY